MQDSEAGGAPSHKVAHRKKSPSEQKSPPVQMLGSDGLQIKSRGDTATSEKLTQLWNLCVSGVNQILCQKHGSQMIPPSHVSPVFMKAFHYGRDQVVFSGCGGLRKELLLTQ